MVEGNYNDKSSIYAPGDTNSFMHPPETSKINRDAYTKQEGKCPSITSLVKQSLNELRNLYRRTTHHAPGLATPQVRLSEHSV